MSKDRETDNQDILVLDEEKQDEKVKPPRKYHVVMLNDDFTPMDFVVAVLVKFFSKSMDEAVAIMFDVHKKGKGIAGTYSRDIAETKATTVSQFAQENEHPFKLTVEPAE